MEDEKMYTTTELVEITGLTSAAVLYRARLFGFTKYCKYVLKKTSWGNYIKEYVFTESQVKAMGCDHYLRSEIVEVVEKTNEEKLEDLKREHPLVTDERCFTLGWFPETIPSVLEEAEK
jgi:hypothetical protein